jgi:nucleotide-binding universal stress UspA family protein
LILEYIPGKIADSIDRLIALYRPDSLVVGTRGRKGLLVTFAGIGSISKYVQVLSLLVFISMNRI